VVGEFHPLAGEAVDVRRLEFFLPVAREVAVAEIVGEDVDDIRFARGRWLIAFSGALLANRITNRRTQDNESEG
jgi:hypothetical protein